MSKAHDSHACTCPSGDGSLRWLCTVHTALLPCPFCGASAAVQNESPADNSGGYFVECKSCGASTNLRYACSDNPVPLLMEQWNARAPQAVAAQAAPAAPDANRLRAEILEHASKASRLVRTLFNEPTGTLSDVEVGDWIQRAQQYLSLATPALPATEDSSAGDLATESVLIEGVAYTIPEPVALELLRLNIELQLAEAQAEPVALQMCSELKPRSESEKAAYLAGVADGRMYAERDADTAPQAQPADALDAKRHS
ncbi:Lar family restriction alleviation protein [Comamonas sp.]|uniref:Lar family restriction alleviation protein n=1 Tax=Comamonas sp. TaxID=34028 RepID=UPI003D0C8C73